MSALQDVRYGLRQLWCNPGFALGATLVLAVSIGANTAIFSVTDTLLLKALPVRNPDQLVTLKWIGGSSPYYDVDSDEYTRYRDGVTAFASIAASEFVDRSNAGIDGPGGAVDPATVHVDLVSGGYFRTLGVGPSAGATFTDADDRPGAQPVAVISHAYWTRRFAGGENAVGRTLTLNGTTYTIVAVMPRGFSGDWIGRPADIWIPLAMHDQVIREAPGLASVRIFARLRDGVAARQAEASVEPVYQDVVRQRIQTGQYPPAIQRTWATHVVVETMRTGYSPERESFGEPAAILMSAGGLLLLIACTNLATLLLARATGRHRETAMRYAIGATRARIIRQLLTESLLLSGIGTAGGVLAAFWGSQVFAQFVGTGPAAFLGSEGAPTSLALTVTPHIDVRSIVFSAVTCVLAAILFGVAPAITASGVSCGSSLSVRESGARGKRLRGVLVAAQVALSLLLIVIAALFARTLRNLHGEDLGFDRQHLLLVWTDPSEIALADRPLWNLWRSARERLSSLPGVESAAVSNMGLLNGFPARTGSEFFAVPGQQPRAGQMLVNQKVTDGYFRTVGITLLRGRDFTARDNDSSSPVVILNETMARFYFGQSDPIGKRLDFTRPHTFGPYTVVGEVADGRNSLRDARTGAIYYPSTQSFSRGLQSMVIVVRTSGNPSALATRVRQELHGLAPELPVLDIDTVDEQVDAVLSRERLLSVLAGLFGALALLLACVGVYGLVSYTVASRTKEFGIRIALGARSVDVIATVLRETIVLILCGIVVGAAATLALTRLIASQLFGVRATDPLTIVGSALLLIATGAIACAPAVRATSADPIVTLRTD